MSHELLNHFVHSLAHEICTLERLSNTQHSNQSYLCQGKKNRYVAKLNVTPEQYHLACLLGEQGLAPRVLGYQASLHILLSEYLPGRHLTTQDLFDGSTQEKINTYLQIFIS